ncbi:small acid-soluble spore protein P [Paenibacillus sp. FSL H8-0034]
MPKNIAQPVQSPSGDRGENVDHQPNKPLAGSKKVKQANHSRNNHGEGS